MRVFADGIELVARNDAEIAMLRRLMEAINGPCCAQPFLQEDPPGTFRFWVDDAAGRVRTARGIA